MICSAATTMIALRRLQHFGTEAGRANAVSPPVAVQHRRQTRQASQQIMAGVLVVHKTTSR